MPIGFSGTLVDDVLMIRRKIVVEDRRLPRRPCYFYLADGFIFPQTKMGNGRVVGMEPAAGFDLAHLVAFAIWPVADDEGAPEAEPIALFIDQLDRDAIPLRIVISVDLERTIQSVGDDVEVSVAVDVDIGVGRTVVAIIETKLGLILSEGFSVLVVEKIVRGKLLCDGHAVDHIKVLPFIVV